MLWWALVFFAVFLIGVTKSGFGSGVGLMIVPMTAIAMAHTPHGEKAALGLLLPLLIIGDFIAVWQYRKLFGAGGVKGDCPSAGQIMRQLLPGTAVGVVLGGLMLWGIHWVGQKQEVLAAALIRMEIGVESVLLVGLHWWRTWRGMQQSLMREPLRGNLSGGFAGISSTLAHAAGPIIAMYLLPLKLDRQLFVGLCAVYFFMLNSAKLPAYYLSGQFAHANILFTLQFLPLVIAGALFGRWINKRMNDAIFTRVVYTITFALGWYILIDGGISLVRGL